MTPKAGNQIPQAKISWISESGFLYIGPKQLSGQIIRLRATQHSFIRGGSVKVQPFTL